MEARSTSRLKLFNLTVKHIPLIAEALLKYETLDSKQIKSLYETRGDA